MSTRESFEGPARVAQQEHIPRRILKEARLLTRPTPARQDAPFRGQGRSSSADPRFTFHALRFTGSCERSENAAGGLFQQPARAPAPLTPVDPPRSCVLGFVLCYLAS